MKFFLSLAFFLPLLLQGQITITVTLSGTPNSTTKLIPADLKYNKYGHFDFTQDDRGGGALDASAYMFGGKAPSNGITYPGLTFSDGAGKNIHPSGSVATNSWANSDTLSDYSALGPTYMNWLKTDTVIRRNWSLLDHGAFHGIDQPGAVALGFDALKNIAANRNYVFRQLSALGDPYVMHYGVVPSADSGYHAAWEQLGYIGGTSQNAFDNYPAEPGADWMNSGIAIVTNYKNDNRYHVQARRFKDLNAGDAVTEYESYLDALFTQATSSTKVSLSYAIHVFDFANFRTIMDYLQTQNGDANDEIWICGLQEFYEYFQTIQQTRIKQTISGTTLTVTLDQSFLPDEIRWRDMSFLLSSNVSVSSVSVSGADSSSYNTSTGLINIYKKKTTGFTVPPYYNATGFVQGKVPLENNDLFIDNNFGDYFDSTLGVLVSKSMLVDGNTSRQYHARLFDGPMIYSPYVVTGDLGDYGVSVDSIRIYKSGNSGFTSKVVLHRNDTDAADTIGTWTSGSGWVKFAGPSISHKYVASRMEIISTSTGGFGNEWEVYGTYLPYTEQTYPHRHRQLGYELGVNMYVWDVIESNSTTVNENKMTPFNALKLRSTRFYNNASFYSQNNGATYSFDPLKLNYHEGKMLRRLKQDNPNLIRWAVVQGQTDQVKQSWRNNPTDIHQIKGKVVSYTDFTSFGALLISAFYSTGSTNSWWAVQGTATNGIPTQYPDINTITVPTSFPTNVTVYIPGGLTGVYNVNDTIWMRSIPVSELNFMYANNSNTGRGTLTTWDSVARMAYVYSARRGRNTNATKYIPYTSLTEPWLNNNDSVGINTAEWTELMNEPNAWWAGYNDYLNGKYLSLAWSKTYDNNKVYSTTLGAKNADTSMIVSTSGLAINTVDLNRAAEVNTRTLRGSRPKETVPLQPTYWKAKTWGWTDNPFDIVQFHNYAYTGGADQYGAGSHSGLPFTMSPAYQAAKDFVWFRDKYAPWAQVDVGEYGYDLHQSSPMNAPAISPYTIDESRAIWTLQTLIEYNVLGIDFAQWYRLMGYDSTGQQFSTMSLERDNGNGTFSLRLVGKYFAQLGEFGDYIYSNTLRSDSLRVHKFISGSSEFYVIWADPVWTNAANAGSVKATFANRTGTYNLPLPNGTQITIRNLQDATVMSSSSATVSGSSYPVTYGMKPVFIQVGAVVPANNGRLSFKRGKAIVKQAY